MKIGIIGAGAIGLTLAAGLASVHDVIVLARRAALFELLEREGVELSGDGGTRHVRVRATVDPRDLAGCEAAIVAVKSYATAAALAPLRGVLPPRALIASVQNGIGNAEAGRTALPDARVVAGSTTQGAIRLGDGRVRPVNRGTTVFGRSDGTPPTSEDLAAAFAAAGLDAHVVDDVDTLLWRKLIVNAAVNPVGALTGRTNGEVVADHELRPLARALAAEAEQVARAEGIDPGDAWGAVEAAARATAANRNSMLQDLDAGRPTEIDAIGGAIVQRARAHGLAVPLTEAVVRLVRARERRS